MSDLLHLTLDAQVAPARVLICHTHDQLALPSQNRVGRDDRGDLVEKAAAERLALGGESAPLVVGEPEPLVALKLSEDAVLFE